MISNCWLVFAWYQNAETCYVYLEDVSYDTALASSNLLVHDMRFSRWFQRGWTLQELLAPNSVTFYDTSWVEIGRKRSLAAEIQAASNIAAEYLDGSSSIRSASIAKRMSWAARRFTSRPEDVAYCLMGIFDVNMPMLYGEGERAFIRLQEEIMKSTDDQTLFSWKDESPYTSNLPSGLLAHTPAAFATTGDLAPFAATPVVSVQGPNSTGTLVQRHETHAVTNRGLFAQLKVTEANYEPYKDAIYAALHCGKEDGPGVVAILLRPTEESSDHFVRVECNQLFLLDAPLSTWRSLCVRHNQPEVSRKADTFYHRIQFEGRPGQDFTGAYIDHFTNQGLWSSALGGKIITIPKARRMLTAYLVLKNTSGLGAYLLLIGWNDANELAFDAWQPLARAEDHELFDQAMAVAKLSSSQQTLATDLRNIWNPQRVGRVLQKPGSCHIVVETRVPLHTSWRLRREDNVTVFSVREVPKPDFKRSEQQSVSPTGLVRGTGFYYDPR